MIGSHRILIGDVLDGLASLPAGSVRCCVTSPPYWGLRQYLPDGVRIRPDLSAEDLEYLMSELNRLGIVPIAE